MCASFFFDRKFLHGVSIGTMRVSERCFSYSAFADNRRDAGQSNFQPHRLGRLRRKQSKLYLAHRSWLGAQRKREHGCRRRMRRKLKLQQLQQRVTILRRQSWANSGSVVCASFEMEERMHRCERQRMRARAQNKLFDHRIQHEEQRVEQIYGSVKLESFFESERSFYRLEVMRMLAARQQAHSAPLLPKPRNEIDFGQRRNLAERF
jgi:hypothetical protein